MTTIIIPERPDTDDARLLIEELEAHLAPFYPATSRHGRSSARERTSHLVA